MADGENDSVTVANVSSKIVGDSIIRMKQMIEADDDLKKLKHELVVVGDGELDSSVPGYLTTQCPSLDYIIGRPGIPRGRLTTIVGMEASGKSSMLQHLLAQTQKEGGLAVLIDSERRYWSERAAAIGIDNDSLVQLTGETLEENLALIEKFILAVRAGDPDIPLTIGYDSIAGSPTQADLDATVVGNVPAKHARVLGVMLRKLHPLVAEHKVCLVLVNQLRTKLEFGANYGRPKMVMVAEHPLTYWSSLKFHLKQIGRVGPPDKPTGIEVSAEILKNTTAPPFKKCQFEMDFKHGVNYNDSALDVALDVGLVTGSSGWYKYDEEEKKFQRKDFGTVLAKHEKLRRMLAAAPLLWETEE